MKVTFYFPDSASVTETNVIDVGIYLDGAYPTKAYAVMEKRNKTDWRRFFPHIYRRPDKIFVESDGGYWRPISTAPKDGTKILVYVPSRKVDGLYTITTDEEIAVVSWRPQSIIPKDPVTYFWCIYRTEEGTGAYSIIDNPTAWMPLPAPPGE